VVTLASQGAADYAVDVRDHGHVKEVVRDARPAGIFHLAGIAFVPEADAAGDVADAVNRGGTANVLDAAAAVGARTLVVSSGAVYGRLGEAELPATENTRLAPAGAYAASKQAAEQECERRFSRQEIVVVRPFNHTGPGQSRQYVCSDFAAQVAECVLGLRPRRIEVGDLSAERDFSDVADVVAAYLVAFERGQAGETYNVCSGRPTPVGGVLDRLMALAGIDIDVVVRDERLRSGEVNRSYGSYAKLERAAGWRPQIPLEVTLDRLLEDWRCRLHTRT
jgi:GDP-4-dehydro-6-deoxy-D-mannose reductase